MLPFLVFTMYFVDGEGVYILTGPDARLLDVYTKSCVCLGTDVPLALPDTRCEAIHVTEGAGKEWGDYR